MDQVKFSKGCLPQILLGPFLNTLSHITAWGKIAQILLTRTGEILERKTKKFVTNLSDPMEVIISKYKTPKRCLILKRPWKFDTKGLLSKLKIVKKLLGIYVNNNLNFDYHVNQLCKKASTKLHALAGIAKYMIVNKRMLTKAFVSSVFFLSCNNHGPL